MSPGFPLVVALPIAINATAPSVTDVNDPQPLSSSNPPAPEGFRISDQPIMRSNGLAAAGNGALSQARPAAADADLLYVIARDPKSLFVYWDLNWKRLFAQAGLTPCQVHLRIYREDGSVEATSEINPFRGHCYAEVGTAGTGYYCELGCLADGEWTRLLRSGKAATPDDRMSDDFTAQFATLPLHLSFQRMLDVLRQTETGSATLANSVAQLQEKAGATSGTNGSSNGTKDALSDLSVLSEAARSALPPTAAEIAQWKKLGEEFEDTRWGGASESGFGGSSPS